MADLEATLNATEDEIVLFATPVDLDQLVSVNKPLVAVAYELEERGGELAEILGDFDYYKLSGG